MRVLLCGGGTGGHIYPALALARYIKKMDQGAEVLFVGAHHGLETRLVPEAGFPLETIKIRPYQRKLRELGTAAMDLSRSSFQVNRLLKNYRPQVVMGTGGYVSGPVVMWSWMRRYPVLIHEQNAVPGKTNRMLAPLVARVCISFDYSRRFFKKGAKTVFTGNPRASEVRNCSREEGLQRWNLSPQKKTLLVFGGSQGALKINEVMVECINRNLFSSNIQIIYVTGERYYRSVKDELKKEVIDGNIQVVPYVENMPEVLAVSDLVVSRAGATALAEITSRGVPALLIPSPNVVNNHQYYNARELEEKGAAKIIPEEGFSSFTFSRQINFLMETPYKLEDMRQRSLELGVPDAVEKVYRCILEVMKRR